MALWAAALVAAQPPASPLPSFALAAYSGGGRVELIDKAAQTVTVRLRPGREVGGGIGGVFRHGDKFRGRKMTNNFENYNSNMC